MKDGLFGDDHIISEQHREGLIADEVAGDEHRVTEPERLLLTDEMNVGDLRDGLDDVEQIIFAALLEFHFEFDGAVEVILNRALVATGDDDDVLDARRRRLLDNVLDRRLVDNREHFFGLSFGGGQKTSAETGGGDNGFAQFHIATSSFYILCEIANEQLNLFVAGDSIIILL